MATLLIQPSVTTDHRIRCEIPRDFDAMDDDAFFAFCQKNQDLRIERTKDGEIEVMAPTGFDTGNRNVDIVVQLGTWARKDGRGLVGESSTGYTLPNGAERAPDASWTLKSRIETVSAEARQKFLPLCPDFVVELVSPSDHLDRVRNKLEEYMDNGAQLGWIIDPFESAVHIYRQGLAVEILESPGEVRGERPVEGFVLDLADILA